MKKTIHILLILLPFVIKAQVMPPAPSVPTGEDTIVHTQKDSSNGKIPEVLKPKKLTVNIEAGATFGTTYGYGNYFGTYIAPQLGYRLTPRLTLSGGFCISTNYGLNTTNTNEFPGVYPFPGYYAVPTSSLFVRGTYQLTDKLTVYGGVHQRIDLLNTPGNTRHNLHGDFNGTSVDMGFKYKVSDNVFIQGEVNISNDPYYNPFYRGYSPAVYGMPGIQPYNNRTNNPF